jgi:hypothetical protein
LLSELFDSLFPLSGRRVPPSRGIVSFVRLLHIRQPDKTMASTGPPKIEDEDEFEDEDEDEEVKRQTAGGERQTPNGER